MQDKPTRRDLMLKPMGDCAKADSDQPKGKAHVFYEGETVEIRGSRFIMEKINRKRMTLRLLQPGDDGKSKHIIKDCILIILLAAIALAVLECAYHMIIEFRQDVVTNMEAANVRNKEKISGEQSSGDD